MAINVNHCCNVKDSTKLDFIIRPYNYSDRAGVKGILDASYGTNVIDVLELEKWASGYTDDLSGYLVAEAGNKIIGVQPMMFIPYTDGKAHYLGALLTGVVVHPEFRRRGVFSALVTACEQVAWNRNARFVTTMPNERSRPGFVKLGYANLGERLLLVRAFNPLLALVRTLKSRKTKEKLAKPTKVMQYYTGDESQSTKSYNCYVADQIDTNIEIIESQYASLVPGMRIWRNQQWWKWRYSLKVNDKYNILEVRKCSGELAGVAVLRWEVRYKLNVGYLMDLSATDQVSLGYILKAASDYCKKRASILCSVTSSSLLAKQFEQNGFWTIPFWMSPKRFYSFIKFNPSFINQTPPEWYTLRGWYQMLGDWDNL
jgi:GNAT superfamily N-acetyltransferase